MALKWSLNNRKILCLDHSLVLLLHHAFFSNGNRKQFLIADNRAIYAFAKRGKKFPTCTSFSDKTCDVQCKVNNKLIVCTLLFITILHRLLMDLLLFHSQDQIQKTLMAEFILVMTVSGLI